MSVQDSKKKRREEQGSDEMREEKNKKNVEFCSPLAYMHLYLLEHSVSPRDLVQWPLKKQARGPQILHLFAWF